MNETETEKQFLIRLFKEKWCEEKGRYTGFLKSLCHIDDVVELVNKCIEAERNLANKDCQHGGHHDFVYGSEGGYKDKFCKYCGLTQSEYAKV